MGRCKMRGESVFTSSNSCGSVRTQIPQGFPLHSSAPEAGRTFSLSQLGQSLSSTSTPQVWPPTSCLFTQTSWTFSAPWKRKHKILARIQSRGAPSHFDFTILCSCLHMSSLRDFAPSSSPPQCLSLTQTAFWKGLGLHYFTFFDSLQLSESCIPAGWLCW